MSPASSMRATAASMDIAVAMKSTGLADHGSGTGIRSIPSPNASMRDHTASLAGAASNSMATCVSKYQRVPLLEHLSRLRVPYAAVQRVYRYTTVDVIINASTRSRMPP